MTTNYPLHNNPQPVGTGSNHTAFANFESGNPQQGFGAIVAVPTAPTGSNHTAFNISTYQMFGHNSISCSFCTGVYPKNISTSFNTSVQAVQSISSSFDTAVLGISRISTSFCTKVLGVSQVQGPIKTSILGYSKTQGTIRSSISIFNPAHSVVLTDPSNPFTPIVALDGTIFVGSPPAGAVDWVTFKDPDGTCDGMTSWSFSLNYLGGQFEFLSVSNNPGIGTPIQFAGLPGIVTESGDATGGSGKMKLVRGIFGTRQFNRQILLTTNIASRVGSLFANLPLSSPTTQVFSTCAEAATSIAGDAGIFLSWEVQDSILVDMFIESGMSVIEALQSLAGRCAGLLVWDGVTNVYKVIPRNATTGGMGPWPDCGYIRTLASYNILDDPRAYVTVPINYAFNGAANYMDPALQPAPPEVVTTLYGTRNRVPGTGAPDDPPPTFITLNPDFKGDNLHNGRIQIVVNPDKVGDPFTTTKHYEWFPAGLPIVQEPFTGVYKLAIGALPFPPNVDDGAYNLNVGYVRDKDPLNNAFLEDQKKAKQAQTTIQTIDQQKLQYLKIKGGSVEGPFLGAVPLPGGALNVTKDGINLQGQIETVSGSSGSLSITVGQWQRIEVLTAKQYIDYFYATGGGAT